MFVNDKRCHDTAVGKVKGHYFYGYNLQEVLSCSLDTLINNSIGNMI